MKTYRKRETFRKGTQLASALLFPLTMLYFSPGIVFRGARLGIISGSYLTFALLFLASLVFGRSWCGFLCPGGGFCEFARTINDRPFTRRSLKLLKYVVWVLWLAAVALVAIFIGKGFRSVDPLLGTDHGVSIHSTALVGFYYLVVGIIMATSLAFGRRGFCHSLCWMAPFMVLGRKLRNALRLPATQLAAESEKCRGCGACEAVCPMSLPVRRMVEEGRTEHVDCVLCGACVTACTHDALRLEFGRPRSRR